MRSFKILVPAGLLVLMMLASSCTNPQASGNNAVANNKNGSNSAPANSGPPKTTGAFTSMPDIVMNTELRNVDGTTFKLKQFEGKVLLVNLWATWCGPCRMEMPELIKLEDEYKDKGFMVIGLDVDPESEVMVKSFVEKQKLNYAVGWSESEVTEELIGISKMSGIPQSFLISQDGRLAAVFRGYDPRTTPQKVKSAVEDTLSRIVDKSGAGDANTEPANTEAANTGNTGTSPAAK